MTKHRRKLAVELPLKRPVGRPRTTGKGTMIAIRWQQPLIDGIDKWAEQQTLERHVALRQIVTKFLDERGIIDAGTILGRDDEAA